MAILAPGSGRFVAGAEGAHAHPDAGAGNEASQCQGTAALWNAVVFPLGLVGGGGAGVDLQLVESGVFNRIPRGVDFAVVVAGGEDEVVDLGHGGGGGKADGGSGDFVAGGEHLGEVAVGGGFDEAPHGVEVVRHGVDFGGGIGAGDAHLRFEAEEVFEGGGGCRRGGRQGGQAGGAGWDVGVARAATDDVLGEGDAVADGTFVPVSKNFVHFFAPVGGDWLVVGFVVS